MHKRSDLLTFTDATSSLTSNIPFSELDLRSVIGGGGFGQVWEARWQGTPVAVKVLTVSSSVERVQRAILQEFAAEINMVSGMRHPNICLYIGACLEDGNRSIVTGELCFCSYWGIVAKWFCFVFVVVRLPSVCGCPVSSRYQSLLVLFNHSSPLSIDTIRVLITHYLHTPTHQHNERTCRQWFPMGRLTKDAPTSLPRCRRNDPVCMAAAPLSS